MTSQADLNAAHEVADDFEKADERLKNKLMVLLAEYDEDPDYETWCAHQKVDKSLPKYEREYHDIHMFYIVLWERLGPKEFFRRLEIARNQVKAVRNSRR
jgi:hypothetical protein